MDCISSIFQLDQLSSDKLFQLPSLISGNQETIKDHMGIPRLDNDTENGCSDDVTSKSMKGRRGQRKASEAFGVEPEISGDIRNHKKNKVVHREVEKKRRQEMASLHGSLRSLLPAEYLKGNRSISDHIYQTMNYIKRQDKRIQQLSEERDCLKTLTNISSPGDHPSLDSSEISGDTSFAVNPCMFGLQVVVDTALQGGVALSEVLQLLTEEGMAIFSCVSTSVNERMLHNVIWQGSYGRSMGTSELQQELIKKLNGVFPNTNEEARGNH